MSDFIVAPWTDEQVEALNRYQTSGWFHEFTCRNDGCSDECGFRPALVATNEGWICHYCSYTQNWAHSMMLEDMSNAFSWAKKEDNE